MKHDDFADEDDHGICLLSEKIGSIPYDRIDSFVFSFIWLAFFQEKPRTIIVN